MVSYAKLIHNLLNPTNTHPLWHWNNSRIQATGKVLDIFHIDTDITKDNSFVMLADSETIDYWYRELGLSSDVCANVLTDTELKRLAILAHITAKGGQTSAYFVYLASKFGYTATIIEGSIQPFRTGSSRSGDSLGQYGAHLMWVMQLTEPQDIDGLYSYMECLVNKYKPAHTLVTFVYGA